MRRMNSKNGIIDIVNEGIESGQIEVGGGLPEIEAGDAGKVLMVNEDEDGVEWGEAGGADNALVLPEVAPASQQLVGINTSGEQNALGIGDGLVIEDGNVKVLAYEIDFKGKSSLTNVEWLATELYTVLLENQSNISKLPKQVFVKNYSTEAVNGLYTLYKYSFNSSTQLYSNLGYVKIDVSGGSKIQVGPVKQTQQTIYCVNLISNGYTNNPPSINTNNSYVSEVTLNYDIKVSFTDNSGTKTGYRNKFSADSLANFNLSYLPDGPNTQHYIPLHVLEFVYNQTILAEGRNATNKYVLNWDLSTGAYTITITTTTI